jgi:hypothetical protein
MKKLLLSGMLLLIATSLLAQIPRNGDGHFEYTQTINLDNSPSDIIRERAEKFFSRPLLVHWDSTYTASLDNDIASAKGGYIEIGITSGMFGSRVNVGLQYIILPRDNGYQYSIRRLTVRSEKGDVFPLEEKPEKMKHKHYDQLVNRTHRYLQRVIAYMKREMNGFQ